MPRKDFMADRVKEKRAEALVALEDALTGQGDRHADNYMIDIDKTDLSVTVKTIDNDANYGVFRKGLYKFSIGPGSVLGCANSTLLSGLGLLKRETNNSVLQSALASMLCQWNSRPVAGDDGAGPVVGDWASIAIGDDSAGLGDDQRARREIPRREE